MTTMTSKQAIQVRRLAWLCGELRAGNAFSTNALWRWEQEARRVLHSHGELAGLTTPPAVRDYLNYLKSREGG